MKRIKHKHNHWLPKLLGVGAITIYPYVFYADRFPHRILVNHELIHVKQVEQIGWIRFYISYLMFYFAFRLMRYDHNKAYYSIPYEVDAYGREQG